MSAPKREIYLLSPKQFSPETIAVAFAKTSRAPESFREIAAELNDEKSARFHEKWVVGYGHASVAEHVIELVLGAARAAQRFAVGTACGDFLVSEEDVEHQGVLQCMQGGP